MAEGPNKDGTEEVTPEMVEGGIEEVRVRFGDLWSETTIEDLGDLVTAIYRAMSRAAAR